MTTHRNTSRAFARRRPSALVVVVLASAICGTVVPGASADPVDPSKRNFEPRMEAAPAGLEGVKITEHLGDKLPLDLQFKDSSGRQVRLADFFDGRTPVVLTLNYSDCPMLCSQQLQGLAEGLRDVDWTLGSEYRVVTVSINPNEAATTARLAQQNYLRLYQRPSSPAGWQFLTGRVESIDALAGAVGFGYRWLSDRREYSHAAVSMICTPDGRLSRYLYGVRYEPNTIRLSLVEASDGRIGTAMDQILLYCFHYDPSAGSYVVMAMTLMRLGGLTMIAVVGSTLILLRRADRRRQAQPEVMPPLQQPALSV